MFGLFKSDKGIPVIDKVWMSKAAKLNACREMLKVDPACIFIAWFEETRDDFVRELKLDPQNNTVFIAENIHADQLRNRILVFVEHHPLREKEQQNFKRLALNEVNVLSSMDEPFFMKFNGAKAIELMRRMGMKEDEMIGHEMIDRSIRKVQKMIAKKVVVEKPASSQQEWFRINAVGI
jgi:hypothetical protein